MSMPSTVVLNCMTGHRIIHTISGRDHRPARPAPLVRHRTKTARLNGKDRFRPPLGVVR
jgi:hypothetical protein